MEIAILAWAWCYGGALQHSTTATGGRLRDYELKRTRLLDATRSTEPQARLPLHTGSGPSHAANDFPAHLWEKVLAQCSPRTRLQARVNRATHAAALAPDAWPKESLANLTELNLHMLPEAAQQLPTVRAAMAFEAWGKSIESGSLSMKRCVGEPFEPAHLLDSGRSTSLRLIYDNLAVYLMRRASRDAAQQNTLYWPHEGIRKAVLRQLKSGLHSLNSSRFPVDENTILPLVGFVLRKDMIRRAALGVLARPPHLYLLTRSAAALCLVHAKMSSDYFRHRYASSIVLQVHPCFGRRLESVDPEWESYQLGL